jgi:hypothetical protein
MPEGTFSRSTDRPPPSHQPCILYIHTLLQLFIYHCRGMKEAELQIHIDKLHEYNEIKDVGQLVLGRLGELFHRKS